MEQSAVEWLVEEISKSGIGKHTMVVHKREIEKAKEMENQQRIDDFRVGYNNGNIDTGLTPEEYYELKLKK
jgi:hypothetical protein